MYILVTLSLNVTFKEVCLTSLPNHDPKTRNSAVPKIISHTLREIPVNQSNVFYRLRTAAFY
jgi:hypothetical protein